MTRLSQLYADLALYEFYLDYLHDSLGNYYSKRQTYWTPQFRRRQIEDIRASIPLVYEDVNEIKKEIEYEKSLIFKGYNENDYYDEYEEYYEYDNNLEQDLF